MPLDLQTLQDGLNASIQTLLNAYDQCADSEASAQLIDQVNQLTSQMKQVETNLFHQQTVEATDVLNSAFASAQGYTAKLNDLGKKLGQVAAIVSTAGKLISVVAQIVAALPL